MSYFFTLAQGLGKPASQDGNLLPGGTELGVGSLEGIEPNAVTLTGARDEFGTRVMLFFSLNSFLDMDGTHQWD